MVTAIHKKGARQLYEIEVKGRLDAPSRCEIMTPTKDFECSINYFLLPDGTETKTIHPGQRDHVLIELSEKVEVGTILRKQKELQLS